MKMPTTTEDFKALEEPYRLYVRRKAIAVGGTIVYVKDGQLIEENPKTLEKKVLKELPFK